MTATPPPRAPLVGRFIRLDPFTLDDVPALWRAIGHPEVFAGGYGGGPAGLPADEAAFAEWAPQYFPLESGSTYVVRVASGPHAGDVVGTSTLGDVEPRNEAAHIGWTAYAPWVWGTQVNVEAKLLLLGTAFDHGFGRVKLQADALNERSRAAIARLGATFEGIARRDRPRADGTWRDTAIFSVLVDEWPEVRAGLERRLAEWGDAPVTYRAS
ncbi:GNAT family protein [Salinibacterium sp. ZJ77]|uniref:GNAT family N-acetyltransferase n=1 Tax=Salinibacterium sp. ZJ77 TaxID=2708337 RepID=UPI001423869F|nr:GNAT family protein [Salinibacterium sp. ZJ77]